MEELMEKIEKLEEALNACEVVEKLQEKNSEIMKDKELLETIKKYQETQDESLREKIIHHPTFREYKHRETNCNFLILEMNQKLKNSFNKDKGCI